MKLFRAILVAACWVGGADLAQSAGEARAAADLPISSLQGRKAAIGAASIHRPMRALRYQQALDVARAPLRASMAARHQPGAARLNRFVGSREPEKISVRPATTIPAASPAHLRR